jgi:methylated-DNA-[protein]-cysteine S-methyltransferase
VASTRLTAIHAPLPADRASDKGMAGIHYTEIESPVGSLLLAIDEAGLRHIRFVDGRRKERPEPSWTKDPVPFTALTRELRAYFRGELERFDQPLAPEGTAFQRKVWSELCGIPYGQTISYQELATRVGNRQASRAVGLANGANPIPIIIPCHRVIGTNGKLTGYGGGLAIKQKLLALERGQLRLL